MHCSRLQGDCQARELSMTSLKIWLEEHGLESLAGLFARSDIDLDVLFELSDHDLKELGLTLGQRRRLLKAFRAEAVAEPAAVVRASPALVAADRAERRQLTV